MSVVTLSESAAGKLSRLMERDDRKGYALRIKVVGGGCSGLQYQLVFDDEFGEWDQRFESRGVPCVVDSKSATHLIGTIVDYVDDLSESGFKIDNPNATSTCGCGQSFGT